MSDDGRLRAYDCTAWHDFPFSLLPAVVTGLYCLLSTRARQPAEGFGYRIRIVDMRIFT